MRGLPIVVNFQDLGNALTAPQRLNNPRSPLPACVSFDAHFEVRHPSGKEPYHELMAYLKFGAQPFKLTDTDDKGTERKLLFSLQLKSARLVVHVTEGIVIDRASMLGRDDEITHQSYKATFKRGKEVIDKLSGKAGAHGELSLDKIDLGVSGGLKGEKAVEASLDAEVQVTAEFLQRHLQYEPGEVTAWSILPGVHMHAPNGQSIKSLLDGVKLNNTSGPLFRYRERPDKIGSALLLGVVASLDDIEFVFDQDNDDVWFQQKQLAGGAREKEEVAKFLLRDYLKKSLGENQTQADANPVLFFAVAAAERNDF